MRKLFLILSAICLMVIALLGVGATAQPEPTPKPDAYAYWKARGCSHGHRSVVTRKRIRLIMLNQTPFTKVEGRRVRHYTYCVATKRKAKANERLVQKLKSWRKLNVCTAAHGNVALGRCMARRDHGWTGGEWSCLYSLWSRESGWVHTKWNYGGSGAYGIPQALPASKMATHGADWKTNPATQIAWGLDYIAGKFGSPCGALAYWNVNKSY